MIEEIAGKIAVRENIVSLCEELPEIVKKINMDHDLIIKNQEERK